MADGSLHGQVVFLTNKHNGLVLDAGPNWNICQWKRSNQPHQKFKLDHAGGGKYHIICEKDGKALTLKADPIKMGLGLSSLISMVVITKSGSLRHVKVVG